MEQSEQSIKKVTLKQIQDEQHPSLTQTNRWGFRIGAFEVFRPKRVNKS